MTYLEQNSDRIIGWRVDSALDFQSTVQDLKINGMTAATKQELPSVDGMRAALLPITRTSQALDEQEPTLSQSFTLIAETREELEAMDARIYGSKTTKKQTGRCYYRGSIDCTCDRDAAAGAFLRACNPLTRTQVLGPELAEAFTAADLMTNAAAQAWLQSL
ncbi:hypothetical protein N9C85_01205 [Synechococcus sp. AH-224-I15]|nr:hypothetical protein [Synechococcus sp. AH-224-I15]